MMVWKVNCFMLQGALIGSLCASTALAAESSNKAEVRVTRVERTPNAESERSPGGWLGVSAEEVPESLSEHLQLKPGEGLLVTFVASNSPAAKAGLEKHSLILLWDDQVLVHPEQLRKLAQNARPADQVKLTCIQSGERRELSVQLGEVPPGFGRFAQRDLLSRHLLDLSHEASQIPWPDELKGLRENLARSGINREQLSRDISRRVEEARKAFQEAFRNATNQLGPAGESAEKLLRELARSRVRLENDAKVTIQNHGNKVRTMVQTDETGTYMLIANPELYLSIHDKAGKLIFGGSVTQEDELESVPAEYRDRAKNMLRRFRENKSAQSSDEASPE